ncbi:MAG: hypothetical protein ACFFBF_10025 [Promethearchaeota archaeon]
MNQEVRLRSFFVPLWLLTLGVPLIVVSLLILSSTTVEYLIRKVFRKDFSKLSKKFEKKGESWSKAKKDTLRKINHVFIFIGLFIIWYIGLFVVNFYAGTSAGMVPEENNMFLLYLRIIDEPNAITEVLFSLGWFYYLLFFFFYSFFLFMIANEFTRKSRFCSFPFNFFPKLYLSGKEKKNYGTYLYFTIGQMFAAFICPPMVLFSILGISSISDLVTSQIGIRFGKKHILWNQNKTWEGTIAGIITTFFLCFFFVGFLWSLIFTLLFLLFDIFTNKPINLSDNLLIPVGCSLTYIFIRFIFDLNYYTIFLSWF